MSGNSFGSLFRLTTFGESHGPGVGGVIDGCPPGIELPEELVQTDLDLRRPGQGKAGTRREEADKVKLLSGLFEGRTTGTPIGFFIENAGQKSKDYDKLKDVFRPGHADLTYQAKYGIRDHRGGGRASARETVSRVVGGAVARALLAGVGIEVFSYTIEYGGQNADPVEPRLAREREFWAADPGVIPDWSSRVEMSRKQGESLGGVVEVVASGAPAGLGEPVLDKLDARLAYAVMGVGAVKGVEIGSGFEAARSTGGRNNDEITPEGFVSNNAGGVLGGISSGQEIVLRAAIKPIPSITVEQRTVTASGEATTVSVGGRHDVSAIPRVNIVLEAMVLMVLADFWLLQKRITI
jgi:chorismate synthase